MESLNNIKIQPNKTDNVQEHKANSVPPSEDKKKRSISASTALLGSLASVGVLGMADILLTKGKYITKITGRGRNLEKEISVLEGKIGNLKNQLAEANEEISKLVLKVEEFSKRKLDALLSKGEIDKELQAKVQQELEHSKLNYDTMQPYTIIKKSKFKPEDYKENYADIKIGTSNRSGMKELVIPEFKADGSFEFELPSGCMQTKKVEMKEFEPFKIQSNISEKYDNSVVWNEDKIARDILQNFFDGHGQTLDGVKIKIVPTDSGNFRVRIDGKSTYEFKNAVIVGESGSHEISRAAGNYGEGLKMATLKLLKQNKNSNVRIGSGNWEVLCKIDKDTRLDADLMNYDISPVNYYDGNFIEFETSNQKLLQALRNSIDRFYHSSNTHFKNPVFENELFGFKLLPEGEKGALYISGQRFEYEGNYDGFDNAIVFIKEKIPESVYDVTRDRSTISFSSWLKISKWLTNELSANELKQVLKSLEAVADNNLSPMGHFCENVAKNISTMISEQKLGAIKFPDNYISRILFADLSIMEELTKNGFKIFPLAYENLGMKSMANMVAKARQHTPLMPTEIEEKKILILKKALNRLSDLTKEHFTPAELDSHIHIFNAKSASENSITRYDNTLAEAIVDNGEHKGFWIDRKYLGEARFSDVLETAIHELSHKVADDGTKEFGYKLTNVNKDMLAQIIENPEVAEEFKILDSLWTQLK